MAGSQLARALGALELLAGKPRGLPLQELADALGMPKSGAHRLLAELIQLRYVVQDEETLRYLLTTRLMSLGFKVLGESGFNEVARPVLNRLAAQSGELVRLAVVDQGRLPFIAKAQGAQVGLRYDPYTGGEADLYCSSSGLAWLATLSDNEAIEHVVRQGFTETELRGARVPKNIGEVLELISATRERGYARVSETWAPGMASMAVVIRDPQTLKSFAVLSIAGPSVRLTDQAMDALVPLLFAAADELSTISPLSQYLVSLNPTQPGAAMNRLRVA